MRVDPRALAAIERKIARAEEHLNVLDDEMRSWVDDGPDRGWSLEQETHDGGRRHLYRLRLTRPIPVEWAVVLGEAVHDLRSALDQAVYWLGVDWTGDELSLSCFPVYTSRAAFYQRTRRGSWSAGSGMHKIRGIGPGPQAFIEALQPYPQRYRRRYCLDVRILNALWNQDKHRLVHLWGLRFSEPHLALREDVAADSVVGVDRRVLGDGAIVGRISCDPPHPNLEMRGEITAGLTVRAGKGARSANLELRELCMTNADVIRKLTGAIGRQEGPIALDVWTAKEQ